MLLCALQQVQQQHRNGAEQQHRYGILGPVHLACFVNARELVNRALDWPEHRIEERAFALERGGHKAAEWLRDREYRDEEKQDLYPTVRRPFRASPAAATRTSGKRATTPR